VGDPSGLHIGRQGESAVEEELVERAMSLDEAVEYAVEDAFADGAPGG
jgi:hypothetical protein